jgi:hypothetical protein
MEPPSPIMLVNIAHSAKILLGRLKASGPHSSEARPVRRAVFIRPRATTTAECGAMVDEDARERAASG